MGKNVIFDNADIKIVGEILEGDTTYLDINLVGEIINNKFIYGSIVKPSFASPCRIITTEEFAVKLTFSLPLFFKMKRRCSSSPVVIMSQ